MSITYTNTWKNLLVALKSKIRAEMKCPVLSGFDEKNKSNHKIIATNDSISENIDFFINLFFHLWTDSQS